MDIFDLIILACGHFLSFIMYAGILNLFAYLVATGRILNHNHITTCVPKLVVTRVLKLIAKGVT